jgi:hypothetical protein
MLMRRYCLLNCRTDIVEFVSTEHTPRNLLIRAVKETEGACTRGSRSITASSSSEDEDSKRARAVRAKFIEEYIALKDMWGVEPFLEGLLEDVLPACAHDTVK